MVRLIAKRMIARKILERGMNLSRKVMNVQERWIAHLRLWSCEGEALYAALRRHAGEFQEVTGA